MKSLGAVLMGLMLLLGGITLTGCHKINGCDDSRRFNGGGTGTPTAYATTPTANVDTLQRVGGGITCNPVLGNPGTTAQ